MAWLVSQTLTCRWMTLYRDLDELASTSEVFQIVLTSCDGAKGRKLILAAAGEANLVVNCEQTIDLDRRSGLKIWNNR